MPRFVRVLAIVALITMIGNAGLLGASEEPAAPEGGVHAAAEGGGAEHSGEHASHNITHRMMLLAFQLAFMLIAAKLGGELFERVLKLPAVLGELAAGMVIGPFALGGLDLPVIGVLFPNWQAASPGLIPISEADYGISTLASIILLFLAGLETDFKQFVKYAGPGGLVGLGGVLGAFVTGDLLTVGFAQSLGHPEWHFMSPVPLFMGTISVATSVGITARVLSEKGKLDTPEGVTILAGAVIDDVLGIIVLAIVSGIAAAETAGGEASVDWGNVGRIAITAFGIWLVATVIMVALAKPLKRLFGIFKGAGVVPGLALGLALLLSGIMESAGLAMIIGAYVAGLALAKEEDLAHQLDRQLRPIYNVLVPIFFCAMGMLVNFEAMGGALVFGLIFSGVAVVSKVVGCALPTFLVKFNTRGALRVGVGMLPRGEVALIVAGYGLASGFIENDMFGVSILMTLVTTVMAPPILVKLFQGGSGIRGVKEPTVPHREVVWATKALSPARLDLVTSGIIGAIRERKDYDVTQVDRDHGIFLVSAAGDDDFDFELVRAGDRLEVHASEPDRDRALGLVNGAFQTGRSTWEDLAQEVPG